MHGHLRLISISIRRRSSSCGFLRSRFFGFNLHPSATYLSPDNVLKDSSSSPTMTSSFVASTARHQSSTFLAHLCRICAAVSGSTFLQCEYNNDSIYSGLGLRPLLPAFSEFLLRSVLVLLRSAIREENIKKFRKLLSGSKVFDISPSLYGVELRKSNGDASV